jgi:signal transduction histidine kinase
MKVVVVTPNAADSALVSGFLREQGIETRSAASLAEVVPQLDAQMGCVVLVEEALATPDVEAFHAALQAQPPWSDLPLLLIAGHDSFYAELIQGLFPHSGNVTLLQRPLHPLSLVSAVNVALRARRRQIEVRDLLLQRERALRQRDEFLAMLSHELRNPLVPIRNAVYLLGTLRIEDRLFVTCRDMIDKQARHITRLVDDLLEASRLEVGKVALRRQRVEVNENVKAAVESCAAATSGQKHRVNMRFASPGPVVQADPVRLEQAICNLVLNASKFTPEGGTIDVEVDADADFAVIEDMDNGPGIRADMLESIFELFTQDSVTLARTKGGLGIGLTLVKRLVELHGGTVRAFSEGIGKGARFEIRLPLEGSVHQAAEPAVDEAPAPRSRRVLVIEDGFETRESLGMLLRAWRHEVMFAASGPEGLEKALEAQPDVAIIDIGLPGVDGYQVAGSIRHHGSAWARQVKLIALTGYGQTGDRERALEAGFDVHLLKPVDPKELRAQL